MIIGKNEWNIIPIRVGTKIPTVNWKEYQTKLYPREYLTPDTDYAVICGRVSNNLVIIDLDYRNDNKQFFKEIFSKFNSKFPRLARTYAEETPNGHHLFYYIKDECPPRQLHQDTRKERALESFQRNITTKFPYLLKGVDILGENGYSLIAPSEGYQSLNDFDILTISSGVFKQIVDFFVLDTPKLGRMRKPFIDILKGEIEIEEQAMTSGKSEHVYWKYLFLEVWHSLKLQPEDLFPILKDTQPAFDISKTITQLNYVNFKSMPLTKEKMDEYFPQYTPKRHTKKSDKYGKIEEIPAWISIKNYLIDKYDVITMKDTDEIMVRDGNIYTVDTEDFYKELERLVEEYGKKSYNSLRNNVIRAIKDTTKFDRDDFCYDKWLINFKNGYYDIMTDKFYDNRHFKNKVFCYEIPHEYRKGSFSCPTFKQCLNEWLGGDAKVKPNDVFEMIGYTMTMNTNLKMAFFIFGEKNTGKSTFQNILEYVIGRHNRSAISLQRMTKDQFGTDGMAFKILNMVGDMSSLKIDDVSIFKVVTGGDNRIESEIKGGKKYTFRNITKVWYNANEIPKIKEDDDAFYSRWILINFPNIFPLDGDKTINNLSDRICNNEDEIQGIIHEAINGARRLYERGYFRMEIIKNSKHIWRYEAEPIYAFLHDKCVKDIDGYIECDEFREKFNKYLFDKGKKPKSMRKITSLLERYNIFRDRLNTNTRPYIYTGIKWKTESWAEELIKNM